MSGSARGCGHGGRGRNSMCKPTPPWAPAGRFLTHEFLLSLGISLFPNFFPLFRRALRCPSLVNPHSFMAQWLPARRSFWRFSVFSTVFLKPPSMFNIIPHFPITSLHHVRVRWWQIFLIALPASQPCGHHCIIQRRRWNLSARLPVILPWTIMNLQWKRRAKGRHLIPA